MTKETLKEMLDTMATKARLCNMLRKDGEYAENFRECPYWSELKGMETALKIMGIEFEYEYNREVTEMTAISAEDIRVAI